MTTSNSKLYQYKSIDKINSYPIIYDSISLTNQYYQWIKSKCTLLNSVCNFTEETINGLKVKSEQYGQDKIKSIDEICYKQLLKLENTCPLILSPTTNVIQTPMNIINEKLTPVIGKSFQFFEYGVQISIDNFIPNIIIDNFEKLIGIYIKLDERDHNSKYERIKHISFKTHNKLSKLILYELNDIYRKGNENIEVLNKLINEKDINLELILNHINNYSNQLKHYMKSISENVIFKLSITTIESINYIHMKLNNLQLNLLEYMTENNSSRNFDLFINNFNIIINEIKLKLETIVIIVREYIEEKKEEFEMDEINDHKNSSDSETQQDNHYEEEKNEVNEINDDKDYLDSETQQNNPDEGENIESVKDIENKEESDSEKDMIQTDSNDSYSSEMD